jgi:hypothetical protein
MGAVQYLPENALLQKIANAIGQHGEDVFRIPRNRATILLMKREDFAHEAELRLIYVQHHLIPSQPILRVSINPAEVFDEITFDPRLEVFERKEREDVIRALKFTGEIGQSQRYQRTIPQIVIGKAPGTE